MRSIRIGVDNGAKGAVVAVGDGMVPIYSQAVALVTVGKSMTTAAKTRREIDEVWLVDVFTEIRERAAREGADLYAIVEQAQTYPGEAAATSFVYGGGYRAVRSTLRALGIEYEIVHPTRWTKWCRDQVTVDSDDPKEQALGFVRRHMPRVPIVPKGCRVPHKGIVDAAVLAAYGFKARPSQTPARLPPARR